MILTNIIRATRTISNLKIAQRFETTFDRGLRFCFNKNLLITNSILSGICLCIGDLIYQKYENYIDKKRNYDWPRTANMVTVGIVMGPIHHYYYLYLDLLLPRVNLKTVTIKVIFDQIIAAPITILGFFYGIGILENRAINEINEEIKQKIFYVFLGDCLFWPPVQFINFYYLPTRYRVFYIKMLVILYDVFLAYMKHHDR